MKSIHNMRLREDGLIERPKTGYQTHDRDNPMSYETKTVAAGEKLRTYHDINGMWGEKLFHEGEWAIYQPVSFTMEIDGNDFTRAGTTNGYACVVIHSKIWEEQKIVHKDPHVDASFRYREDAEVVQPCFETETIELVCHTQNYPIGSSECLTCHAKIPEGVIALWKMMNAEHLSEEA